MGKLLTELVFIASPLMGHLTPAVELARLMIHREECVSITFLLMKLPIDSEVNAFIDSLITSSPTAAATKRLCFLHLPPPRPLHEWSSTNRGAIFDQLIEYQKPHIREMFAKLITNTTTKLGGFIIDLLSTSLIEVADEFEVPSYVYFTSSAAFLSLTLHFQTLQDELNQDISEFKHSPTKLVMPCFVEQVPPCVLPSLLVNPETWSARFLKYARGYRKATGIIINTFSDLESHPLKLFSERSSGYGKSRIPKIYPLGPIINQMIDDDYQSDVLMKWLDNQPLLSVVFICFGSMGSFGVDQVREIAYGVKQSGSRFLWVLRQPPEADKVEFPGEYDNFEEVLPEGFLDQTAAIGKVVGWVPQLAVLNHSAIGGFVSHCGWNSILESLWCGVPIATWPLYAEQKLNAFHMVEELGLAVEIPTTMSDKASVSTVISAELIETGIRRLMMEGDGEVIRWKVRGIREKSQMNMQEGGSSYTSLGNLIRHLMDD